MDPYIALAVDVDGDADRVFEILSTTDGQRAFWTADCDVSADSARFGFDAAPVDSGVRRDRPCTHSPDMGDGHGPTGQLRLHRHPAAPVPFARNVMPSRPKKGHPAGQRRGR